MPGKRSPKADAELIPITLAEGIEVDYCPVTKGIWFDAGELNVLTNLKDDIPQLGQSLKEARETNYPSPSGRGNLWEMKFHPDYDVMIDFCKETGGVWLDKGELEKLVKISASLGDPRSKIMKAVKFFRDNGYEVLGAKIER